MGEVPGDTKELSDQKPRHRVKITQGFWIGGTPVTVAAYQRFVSERTTFKMPKAPSFNSNWANQDHPVVSVTWSEAQAYCEWAGGNGGRLPYEAEWEYAARGGKEGLKYPWGNEIRPENANYSGSKLHRTSPVRSYPANGFGLYDMSGNVWNWVADWYDAYYYDTFQPGRTADDPHGPSRATEVRVLRGGSFYDVARDLRASGRDRYVPDGRNDVVGFRCVREVIP